MTTQEQAFKAYYASMADDELLRIEANKVSFVDVAQRLLADELSRRGLEAHDVMPDSVPQKHPQPGALAKLMHKLQHLHFSQPQPPNLRG
jgi:hypothetical protein